MSGLDPAVYDADTYARAGGAAPRPVAGKVERPARRQRYLDYLPVNEILPLTVEELLERTAAGEPNPGAGSTAAVTAGLAAGLIAMCARASRDEWPESGGVAAQAETLRGRLAPLAEENAVAYGAALDALRAVAAGEGPGDRELAEVLDRAAAILERIAESAADVAELGASAADRGIAELRPDAVSAAVLGDASARIALRLIEANLVTTESDDRLERTRAHCARAAVGAEQAGSD
jgi:formiminotetrahydrofolate cyclodeaminase